MLLTFSSVKTFDSCSFIMMLNNLPVTANCYVCIFEQCNQITTLIRSECIKKYSFQNPYYQGNCPWSEILSVWLTTHLHWCTHFNPHCHSNVAITTASLAGAAGGIFFTCQCLSNDPVSCSWFCLVSFA